MGLSARIAYTGASVLLSLPVWSVSCTNIGFLRILLEYSVSSEIAGDIGSGVVGLAGLVSPKISSRTFPSYNTVNLLSVRSRSPW